MNKIKSILRRLLPLIILLLLLIVFFALKLNRYFNFDTLQEHQKQLNIWTQTHIALASLTFIVIYTLGVAISIPGALFFTLIGGLLFGPFWGLVLVVIGATLGATLVFLAVRLAFAAWLADKASGWMAKMREGFKHNAFSYLLTLRLIPIFPFWAINIVPALLDVSTKTFILATFLGIIPGSLVYVLIGNGLGHLLEMGKRPDLTIIFDPQILIPLLALAVFALLPIFFKRK